MIISVLLFTSSSSFYYVWSCLRLVKLAQQERKRILFSEVGRDNTMSSQPSPAHCMKSGTSLTGTSLAKAFTLRFRSSVSKTTSRFKRRGCPSSVEARKLGFPNFLLSLSKIPS